MAAQQPGPTARQRLKHERPSPRTRVSRWSLFEDKGTTWIDAVHRPGLAWYPPEVFLRGEPNFVARCQLLQVFIDVVEVLYICANEIFEPGVAVETSPAATNLDDPWPHLFRRNTYGDSIGYRRVASWNSIVSRKRPTAFLHGSPPNGPYSVRTLIGQQTALPKEQRS